MATGKLRTSSSSSYCVTHSGDIAPRPARKNAVCTFSPLSVRSSLPFSLSFPPTLPSPPMSSRGSAEFPPFPAGSFSSARSRFRRLARARSRKFASSKVVPVSVPDADENVRRLALCGRATPRRTAVTAAFAVILFVHFLRSFIAERAVCVPVATNGGTPFLISRGKYYHAIPPSPHSSSSIPFNSPAFCSRLFPKTAVIIIAARAPSSPSPLRSR